MIKSILLVGLGGAVGSILRYLTGFWLSKYSSAGYPWSTFVVNIIGSFVIGLLTGYLSRSDHRSALKLLLVTGICGGYTTFAAFTAENIGLMEAGQWTTAFLYISSSLLLGFAAVFAGLLLSR